MKLAKALCVAFFFSIAGSIPTSFAATAMKFDWNKTSFTGDGESSPDVGVDSSGTVVWGFVHSAPASAGPIYSIRKFSSNGAEISNKDLSAGQAGVSRLATDANGSVAVIVAGIVGYNTINNVYTYVWSSSF